MKTKMPIIDFFMDTDFNFWLISAKKELLFRNEQANKTRIFLDD